MPTEMPEILPVKEKPVSVGPDQVSDALVDGGNTEAVETKKPFQVYFEQHDLGALNRMNQYAAEVRAREKIALEEAWKKFDAYGPPQARKPAVPSRAEHAGVKTYQEDMRKEKEHGEALLNEARQHRERVLEKKHLFRLSKEEYGRYFSDIRQNDRGFRQGNTGNCYEIAALHAMSHSANFELLVRSSMYRRPDGVWEVRIPLLDKEGEKILIFPEEVRSQKNAAFGKKMSEGMIDKRAVLHPVQASEGIRVLEAAYIKSKFGTVDRLAAEGGWELDVLQRFIGLENCFDASFDAVQHTREEKDKNSVTLAGLPNERMVQLDSLLEAFDSGAYIVTAGTPPIKATLWRSLMQGSISEYWSLHRKNRWIPHHAYSVVAVDKQHQTVSVADPYDTAAERELSYGQFKSIFRSASAVRINHAGLLRNMEALQGDRTLSQ